jgi:hypothetical protein
MPQVVFKQTDVSKACVANFGSYPVFEARLEPSSVENFVLIKLWIREIIFIHRRFLGQWVVEELAVVFHYKPHQLMIRIE